MNPMLTIGKSWATTFGKFFCLKSVCHQEDKQDYKDIAVEKKVFYLKKKQNKSSSVLKISIQPIITFLSEESPGNSRIIAMFKDVFTYSTAVNTLIIETCTVVQMLLSYGRACSMTIQAIIF